MNTIIPKHSMLAIASMYDEARAIIKHNELTALPSGYPVTPAIAVASIELAVNDAEKRAFIAQEEGDYQKMSALDSATWDLDMIRREIEQLGRQVWA